MTFLTFDFQRGDKFRFTFFALVEVHHIHIKEPFCLIKTFFSKATPTQHPTATFFLQSELNRQKHLQSHKKSESMTQENPLTHNRETKIFNLLCNVSLILMTMITDAFSQVFTNITKEMVEAISSSFGAPQDTSKSLDDLEKKFPEQLRKELISMKTDLQKQFDEKKENISTLLSNPQFDTGLAIIDRVSLPLPKLTEDLDERSLLGYLALLQTEDPQVSSMFTELFEWMNTLPKFDKKEE
jgi:hypothetical protein